MRAALSMAVLGAALALAPSPAGAAQRLETIDLPSTAGNVDLIQSRLNRPATTLQANVLLPDGYDAEPGKRWPVFYLLPGVGDTMATWANPKKGNITAVAKDFPGIIVMPEGGRGYFVDWWRGGKRDGSSWMTYYLDEVVPQIEARYRITPGRANHAIGGISMGGYGGMLLSSALPSYFGNAISLSGMLNNQAPNSIYVLPVDIRSPYTRLWGRPNGPYATVTNPINLGPELKHTRLYVYTGNGTVNTKYPFDFAAWTSGALAEQEVRTQSLRFAGRVRAAGGTVTYSTHTGVHDWPYWRNELPRVLAYNPFGVPPIAETSQATQWRYDTMAGHGNMWGLGFRFDALPLTIASFTRDGQQLTATGSGTVTINPGAADADASGAGSKPQCSFTATLPFTRTLPAGC
ncbi:MAG: alpha/beta hydrolase-fold protein [Patulibacter sp.]